MIKVLFICHGNICRSPTAEFLMKELVSRAGLSDQFNIASAATSSEELGSGVYPPSRRLLTAYGIDCSQKRARRIESADYERYDYIIGMDRANRRNLLRLAPVDSLSKVRNLLDFAGREGEEVADPWYTGEFELTWRDVMDGCAGLLRELSGIVTLDFSLCRRKEELYEELARKLDYESWYGHNLDALWDILSGMEHEGERFVIMLPFESAGAELYDYAGRVQEIFKKAGKLC